MNKKVLVVGGIVGLLMVVVLASLVMYKRTPQASSSVSSFDECAAAGYPVTESYPAECRTPDGGRFTQTITTASGKSDVIRVFFPAPNSEVTSPLEIRGEARGTWFFEASFPIRLVDPEGKILGTAIAQAAGEWMTEEFVPFTAKLEYAAPSTTSGGELLFEKDNPSGLPEHADEFRMPILFGAQETMIVRAYFGKEAESSEDCQTVFPLERRITKTTAVARAAVEELLKGPTEAERGNGYFTSLNSGVSIQRLVIKSGTARVDFSAELERAVGGSCRVTAIRSQIMQTLKQFSTVQNVIISIDGRTEDILQP